MSLIYSNVTVILDFTSHIKECILISNFGFSEIGRSSTKIKEIQQLVGCDRPHVYENKIKRRQHTPKNNTEYMTAAEVLEYHKKREEQLQELEVKKMRMKSILNQQVNILLFSELLHNVEF